MTKLAVLPVLVLLVSSVACDAPEVRHNRAPTCIITSGPEGTVTAESLRFEWQGGDADGKVVGYCFGLDDSTPGDLTESCGVTLHGLAFGPHDFYVQAMDDSGARSVAAVRSFVYEHTTIVIPRGTDSTIEVATWNIENMPKSSQTVTLVRQLVAGLGLDIYAVQEIADTESFRVVLAGLPDFDGLYSADDYGNGNYQKTGVIYRRNVVTVTNVHQLFWHNGAFPRPPLEMDVVVTQAGRTMSFRLIVMHLKAGGSASDREQRLRACQDLKAYIDGELVQGSESTFVVVGDWNDELDDEPTENVFAALLEDSLDYRFLTLPLAGNSHYSSYIGGGLIDHVMVTAAALPDYAGGLTATLRLDDEIYDYVDLVSDHRPVMAVFAGRE